MTFVLLSSRNTKFSNKQTHRTRMQNRSHYCRKLLRCSHLETVKDCTVHSIVAYSVRSRGGMGGHVSPSKNSRPPSEERTFVPGGMPKRPPQK